MIQVYVDTEQGINNWLRENQDKKVMDMKLSANELGEIIMITYEENNVFDNDEILSGLWDLADSGEDRDIAMRAINTIKKL